MLNIEKAMGHANCELALAHSPVQRDRYGTVMHRSAPDVLMLWAEVLPDTTNTYDTEKGRTFSRTLKLMGYDAESRSSTIVFIEAEYRKDERRAKNIRKKAYLADFDEDEEARLTIIPDELLQRATKTKPFDLAFSVERARKWVEMNSDTVRRITWADIPANELTFEQTW